MFVVRADGIEGDVEAWPSFCLAPDAAKLVVAELKLWTRGRGRLLRLIVRFTDDHLPATCDCHKYRRRR